MRVEVSNCNGDDFVQCMTRVTAAEGEHSVSWKLPNRLLERNEVLRAALEEIGNELQHYIEHIVPTLKRLGIEPSH